MTRDMLNTNTVRHLLKGHDTVAGRIQTVPIAALCLSAITAGEIRDGLAKRPDATRFHPAVAELRKRVDVLPWDEAVAATHGDPRAHLARQGQTIAPLDLCIPAHARHLDAVLVTNDHALQRIDDVTAADWTR